MTSCNRFITCQAEGVFALLGPLLADQQDQPPDDEDPEDFAEEQGLVGRFVHLLQADDPDQQYQVGDVMLRY